ncbi:MAG TPA: hypothetical protein VFD13_03255 [Candidatus Kapabacteria bacterium]|nr:hypothetical protein [Candidatus Kapabacteria bacterium]
MAQRTTISDRAATIGKPARPKSGVAAKKVTSAHPLAWLDRFHAKVPQEAWDNVPTDGARNLDHYLYGAPKQRK